MSNTVRRRLLLPARYPSRFCALNMGTKAPFPTLGALTLIQSHSFSSILSAGFSIALSVLQND